MDFYPANYRITNVLFLNKTMQKKYFKLITIN